MVCRARLGETGSGKELIAQALHRASSRHNGPFVIFDCGATAAPLAASELFGIPRLISVPIMAVVVWLIVVRASYTVAEKIFIVLSTALLTYVGAAFLARPDWGTVVVRLVVPV